MAKSNKSASTPVKSPVKPRKKKAELPLEEVVLTPELPPAPPAPRMLKWIAQEGTVTVGSTVLTRWTSEDGAYRVTRLAGSGVRYGSEYRTEAGTWDTCQRDMTQGPGYPRYYEGMPEAVAVCIAHGSYDGSDAHEVMGSLMNPAADLPAPRAARAPRPEGGSSNTTGTVRPSNMGNVYLAWVENPDTPAEQLFQLTDGNVKLETVHHWLACWKRGYKFPAIAKTLAAKAAAE